MRLDRLQSYLVHEPTALVIEDRDERILIFAGSGTAEEVRTAIGGLRSALDEWREEVDPYTGDQSGQAVAA